MICIFSESVYNKDCCTGHGAARLARLHGVQEALGSNPSAPTNSFFSRENENEDDFILVFVLMVVGDWWLGTWVIANDHSLLLTPYSLLNESIPMVQITQCFIYSSSG